jgi:hypothetical protein
MEEREPILCCWNGGKDGAMALACARDRREIPPLRGRCSLREPRKRPAAPVGMTVLGGSVEMIAKVHWEIAKGKIPEITRAQNISRLTISRPGT